MESHLSRRVTKWPPVPIHPDPARHPHVSIRELRNLRRRPLNWPRQAASASSQIEVGTRGQGRSSGWVISTIGELFTVVATLKFTNYSHCYLSSKHWCFHHANIMISLLRPKLGENLGFIISWKIKKLNVSVCFVLLCAVIYYSVVVAIHIAAEPETRLEGNIFGSVERNGLRRFALTQSDK